MSIASTYAEALFEAASEQDAVAEVAEQLDTFTRAVDDSPELAGVLSDPNLDAAAKKSVVTKLTEQANPVVPNFLRLLVDRGRLAELGGIARAFQTKVFESEGRIEITAVTAVPLDDEMREKILQRVEMQTGRAAELTERVDEDLIGGIVLEVGEIRVDGSIRHRLDTLRRKLATAPVSASG